MTLKQAKRGSMAKWDRGKIAYKQGDEPFREWWDEEGRQPCDLCKYRKEQKIPCSQCLFADVCDTGEFDALFHYMWHYDKRPPKKIFMAMYSRVKEIQED